jgi:uncharacterized membrane protein YdjX (TVP38/TMEM64 family)
MSGILELQLRNLSAGFITAFIIILLLIADILIPVPSSIVMILSGILFGGFIGGLITLTGSMIGSIINFQLSRILGQTRIKSWLGDKEYQTLSKIMQKYGAYTIILTRMVPLAMESTSAIAGVSNMKLKKFIVLNLVGYVPMVFYYSYTGALYKTHISSLVTVLIIGFFVPLLLWFSLLKMTKTKMK